jgi:hypothetical protein
MDLLEWLSMNANCAKLAMLISKNGGTMEVTRFGTVTQSQANRYGVTGLTLEEAFLLQYMRGAFDALSQGKPAIYMARVKEAIDQEIRGTCIAIPTAEEQRRLIGRSVIQAR